MKKYLVLGLSLSLVACNCSKEGGKSSGADLNVQTKLASMLAEMPDDDAGLVLAVHDLPGALVGAKAQLDRLAGAIDDPAKVEAALKARFGFSIFDVAGWKSAGVDANAGLGVWFGGQGAIKDWTAFVAVGVADKATLLATAKRLAKREGAMDLGEAVKHEGGEWVPFQRTLGQKVTEAGGVFIKGNRAIFTSSPQAALDRLKAGTKRLDANALYKELVTQVPGLGQGIIFATRRMIEAQAQAEGEGDALKLGGSGWLASFAATAAKVNVDSVSKSEGEALKALKALMPDPLPVPAIPAQSIIAWQQSADIKAVMSLVAQAPQFAQSMSQLETALKQFEVDLHNDLLKTIGTTYSLWAGAGKDPISALTLLATAFVGLDIAGGDPQAFVDTVKKLIEKSGAPVPMLTGVPNGFDLSHEMGKLEIRADNASKRLSFRFGKVPAETLVKTRPKAKGIGLTKDQQSAGWLDFQALATAVKVGAGLAGASPIGALAGKAATAVAQYDYLIVTGGMKGPYQTGHGELVMKAAAPSK